MADEAARHARIEDDGDVLGRRHLARIEARDRTFARKAADLLGRPEITDIEAAVEIVVALHLRAFAGNRADGATETGRHVGAGETVRGNENQTAHAGRSAGTAGVGDA
ncbi:hypothetical protein D9M72_597340 [compost metagenome]